MVGTVASSKIHPLNGVSHPREQEVGADASLSVETAIAEALLKSLSIPELASCIANDDYIAQIRESIREQRLRWVASNASNSAQIPRAHETIRERQAFRTGLLHGTNQPTDRPATIDQSAQWHATEAVAASVATTPLEVPQIVEQEIPSRPLRIPTQTSLLTVGHSAPPTPPSTGESAGKAEAPIRHMSDDREQLPRSGLNESSEKILVDEVRIIVGPFTKFQTVHEFRNALSSVPGIRHIRVRRLYQGRLHLIVTYENSVPLADRLQHTGTWPRRVTVAGTDLVEVELLDSSG